MNIYEKMREALEQSANLMDRILVRTELDDEIHRIALEAQNMADGALLLSPRNCDVGTAEEQYERYCDFTGRYNPCTYEGYVRCSEDCPICRKLMQEGHGELLCQLEWAQMPYEPKEGGV